MTRTPHELAVEALEEAHDHLALMHYDVITGEPSPIVVKINAALEALRAQKPVDVGGLKRKLPRPHNHNHIDFVETKAMVETRRYVYGWNDAIDHLSTKYNLTEKE